VTPSVEVRPVRERTDPARRVRSRSATSRDPVLLEAVAAGLVSGIVGDEPGLRLRCAIGLERLTRTRPELLGPHRSALLTAVSADDHPDVQWQLARLVPRFQLDDGERGRAVEVMVRLFDQSPIGMVRANALEAVVALAQGHPEHEELAGHSLERGLGSTSASVRSRAWRLVAQTGHSAARHTV